MTSMKTAPFDARGLRISPTTLSGDPYTPKGHCGPCLSEERGTGRTFAMVKALTEDVRFIVVHTTAMKDYIERMLWDHRRDLIHNSVRRPHVVVVQSMHDIDRLRGCVFEVDHAVWDTETLSQEARSLLRALQRSHMATRRGT